MQKITKEVLVPYTFSLTAKIKTTITGDTMEEIQNKIAAMEMLSAEGLATKGEIYSYDRNTFDLMAVHVHDAKFVDV